MTKPREDDVVVTAESGVLIITLNRPAQRNAMTLDIARVVASSMRRLDNDPNLRVGVLTGAGGVFCAGMDLKRFQSGERPFIEGRGFGGLVECPPDKPLIAAVEGWALGGGFELVLACDLVVASQTAKFGLPEVKRGLVARAGGIFRVAQALPRAIALEMLLTGEPIDAQKGHALGLVNHLVDEGKAVEKATVIATAIGANAPLAVRASKALSRAARTWTDDEAFERQPSLTDPVFASNDAREGASAFAERRAPRWTGS
ncbi:enoyl-CoA hydratase [Nocardioides sp. S5]|uniref:crotonase/enoyl-CoA hydratase family protein n=1 Tax=Nocardioides sp. S5 TaxID=2017486 RepID=UPI001A8F0A31|nr:crotonase/enoyl-CoA hydratase family protein [Nocardioides sp. S5]QSR32189.1 enoyl-CoA hydratase [Nocardioides sp. S5]